MKFRPALVAFVAVAFLYGCAQHTDPTPQALIAKPVPFKMSILNKASTSEYSNHEGPLGGKRINSWIFYFNAPYSEMKDQFVKEAKSCGMVFKYETDATMMYRFTDTNGVWYDVFFEESDQSDNSGRRLAMSEVLSLQGN